MEQSIGQLWRYFPREAVLGHDGKLLPEIAVFPNFSTAAHWNRYNPPASPCFVGGKGGPCEKEQRVPCEEES
jgi:hypothetical protein